MAYLEEVGVAIAEVQVTTTVRIRYREFESLL